MNLNFCYNFGEPTVVEEQSAGYAASKLKYLNNDPLPFVYESTGELTRFTDLFTLICRIPEIDPVLTAYDQTVNRNFQDRVFKKQAGTLKFNDDQMNWLRKIKDYVATSFHLEIDDLDYIPFDALGGRGRMYQLFGDGMNMVISELNEALAA